MHEEGRHRKTPGSPGARARTRTRWSPEGGAALRFPWAGGWLRPTPLSPASQPRLCSGVWHWTRARCEGWGPQRCSRPSREGGPLSASLLGPSSCRDGPCGPSSGWSSRPEGGHPSHRGGCWVAWPCPVWLPSGLCQCEDPDEWTHSPGKRRDYSFKHRPLGQRQRAAGLGLRSPSRAQRGLGECGPGQSCYAAQGWGGGCQIEKLSGPFVLPVTGVLCFLLSGVHGGFCPNRKPTGNHGLCHHRLAPPPLPPKRIWGPSLFIGANGSAWSREPS